MRGLALLLIPIALLARVGIRQGVMRSVGKRLGSLKTKLRIRFAVGGLILGGTWVWRTHAPLWERLIRLAIAMLIVIPAVRWLLRRSRGDEAPTRQPVWNWYWFGMKLALIVVGTVVQLGLETVTSRTAASWSVGAAVAVAVALGGPPFTIWAYRRRGSETFSRSGEPQLGH